MRGEAPRGGQSAPAAASPPGSSCPWQVWGEISRVASCSLAEPFKSRIVSLRASGVAQAGLLECAAPILATAAAAEYSTFFRIAGVGSDDSEPTDMGTCVGVFSTARSGCTKAAGNRHTKIQPSREAVISLPTSLTKARPATASACPRTGPATETPVARSTMPTDRSADATAASEPVGSILTLTIGESDPYLTRHRVTLCPSPESMPKPKARVILAWTSRRQRWYL